MSKTLLLADDSVTMQKVVGITFANEDIELVTVDNGDAALDKARAIQPDIVLADVGMPGMNGYELCHALKSEPTLKHVQVILLTGTFDTYDEARAREVGADAHVAKPFEAQALVDKVHELLRNAGERSPALGLDLSDEPIAEQSLEAATAGFGPAPDDDELAAPELGADDLPAPTRPAPRPAPEPARFQETQLLDAEMGSDPEFLQSDSLTSPLGGPMGEPDFMEAEPLEDDPLRVEPPGGDDPFDMSAPEPPRDAPPRPTADFLAEPDDAPTFDVDPLTPDSGMETTFLDPNESLGATAGAEPMELPELDATADMFGDPDDVDPIDSGPFVAPPKPTPSFPAGETVVRGFPPLDSDGMDEEPAEAAPTFDLEPEPERRPPARAPEPAADRDPAFAPTLLADDSDDTGEIELQSEEEIPWAEPLDGGPQMTLQSPAEAAQELAPAPRTPPAAARQPEPARTPAAPAELATPSPASPARAHGAPPVDAQQMREAIEKVAWEAFGTLSEQVVREVVKKVEEIAWETIPQLAERMIRDEIDKLKGE